MKRIFELNHQEIMSFSKASLLETIKKSEGRTIAAETVISCQSLIYGTSNPEMAAAFGADMITLNAFDFTAPFVSGLNPVDEESEDAFDATYIKRLKSTVGRFIGVNMEPVPETSDYPMGLRLNRENLETALWLGFDYIVITGNPNTGVTSETIVKGIEEAAEILGHQILIIAGKMHGAGGDNIYDPQVLAEFAQAGADVVMIPAPGTVPGMDPGLARKQIEAIHRAGALAKAAMGTSQEGASSRIVEDIGMMSKMAGADIIHIGDAGYSGMADPENIMALSIAVRGKRHTYRRMGYSIRK